MNAFFQIIRSGRNACSSIFNIFWNLGIYRVSHIETDFLNWLWGIEGPIFFWFMMPKGQLISKANCQAEDSSKKRTNEFIFTSMRRVFVRFLEESLARKKCFEIIWPLSREHKKSQFIRRYAPLHWFACHYP